MILPLLFTHKCGFPPIHSFRLMNNQATMWDKHTTLPKPFQWFIIQTQSQTPPADFFGNLLGYNYQRLAWFLRNNSL